MVIEAEKVLEWLDLNGIPYECVEHEAVYTTAECDDIERRLGTRIQKNLFLRNKQKTQFYILILDSEKKFNATELCSKLGLPKLSFGSEELLFEKLGLIPGCVSPFGLLNDVSGEVSLIIDSDVMKEKKLSFHPNTNRATLALEKQDFEKFLHLINVKPLICAL